MSFFEKKILTVMLAADSNQISAYVFQHRYGNGIAVDFAIISAVCSYNSGYKQTSVVLTLNIVFCKLVFNGITYILKISRNFCPICSASYYLTGCSFTEYSVNGINNN